MSDGDAFDPDASIPRLLRRGLTIVVGRTKPGANPTPNTHKDGVMKGFQTVFPTGGKRLKQHIAYPQLIPRALEGHNVMGIMGNAFGIFAHGKHVLAQVNHRDVLMMGMFDDGTVS